MERYECALLDYLLINAEICLGLAKTDKRVYKMKRTRMKRVERLIDCNGKKVLSFT